MKYKRTLPAVDYQLPNIYIAKVRVNENKSQLPVPGRGRLQDGGTGSSPGSGKLPAYDRLVDRGFGSNLDRFRSKLKCNYFFKMVSYGQNRASRYNSFHLKASCTSKANVMFTFVIFFPQAVVISHHPLGGKTSDSAYFFLWGLHRK